MSKFRHNTVEAGRDTFLFLSLLPKTSGYGTACSALAEPDKWPLDIDYWIFAIPVQDHGCAANRKDL